MAKSFENDDLSTLKVIAETLNRSNDLHDMLQTVLEKLLSVTGLTTGWIFLVDEKPDYTFVADYNLPPALSRENKKPMCHGGCTCLSRYWSGELDEPVNIIECQRLDEAKTKELGEVCGLQQHATVPLTAGGERFGILNVAAPHKAHFNNKELTLLQSVAYQIGTAVKRIRLAQKQQELILVEERNRLTRDLHDSVNQKLFSLSLTARGAKAVKEKPELLEESLDQIQHLSKDALKEMRALIWQLRPTGVEDGVITTLRKYGKYLGLTVEDEVDGVQELPRLIEETLWRIGQEALNNIQKHAKTNHVAISMKMSQYKVTMRVSDRGQGCDLEAVKDKDSFGLTSMKERAKLFNGTLTVKSEPQKGTEVEVSLPIKMNESSEGYGH